MESSESERLISTPDVPIMTAADDLFCDTFQDYWNGLLADLRLGKVQKVTVIDFTSATDDSDFSRRLTL